MRSRRPIITVLSVLVAFGLAALQLSWLLTGEERGVASPAAAAPASLSAAALAQAASDAALLKTLQARAMDAELAIAQLRSTSAAELAAAEPAPPPPASPSASAAAVAEPPAASAAAAAEPPAAQSAAAARALELTAMLERGMAAINATMATRAPGLSRAQLARGLMSVGRLGPYLSLADKALRIRAGAAEEVAMVLFGGSTAAGEELGSPDQSFAHMFAAFLEEVLQVPVAVNNLAMGATSSDYYALCGGSHMLPGSDVILAEHALNDLYYAHHTFGDFGATGKLDASPHMGSVLEQVLQQGRTRAPDAIFFYAGVIPNAGRCWSGEDNPGNAEALAHWDVGYASTRNLVLGRPPTGSLWTAWEWGQDAGNCAIEPPFTWESMFPIGAHPVGMANVFLSLIMASATVEALAALHAAGWVAPPPAPPPAPLHALGHDDPCMGGPPFDCRTSFTPNTGAQLKPLATACVVSWAGREPSFDPETCGDVFSADQTPPTPVVGWSYQQMYDSRLNDPALRVRHDVKTYWHADEINATIRFPVRVGARGQIGVGFFNGHVFGAVTMGIRCGDGPCDLHAPTIVHAYEGQRVTTTRIPFRGLPSGTYLLEITAWPGQFGLVAVAG